VDGFREELDVRRRLKADAGASIPELSVKTAQVALDARMEMGSPACASIDDWHAR
jgi:hypothetical protein